MMNEQKARDLGDILVAVVDGLKGFPEAINAMVQTCMVRLIRHSMNFAGLKDRKPVAQALRAVCRAKDAEAAATAPGAFEDWPWGAKCPVIGPTWRRNWDLVLPFFAFPQGMRRIITPRMPWRPWIRSCARRSAQEVISQITMPPRSCYIWFSSVRPRTGNARPANGPRPGPNSPSFSAKDFRQKARQPMTKTSLAHRISDSSVPRAVSSASRPETSATALRRSARAQTRRLAPLDLDSCPPSAWQPAEPVAHSRSDYFTTAEMLTPNRPTIRLTVSLDRTAARYAPDGQSPKRVLIRSDILSSPNCE